MKYVPIALVGLSLIARCTIGFEPAPDKHYNLSISVGFSPAQADMIIDAAIEWQNATGGYITFDGAGQPGGAETIEFMTEKERQPDPGLYGETWNEGVPSVIVVYTSLDDKLFRQSTLHELGHALGLQHAGAGTIMCHGAGCASQHVTCKDVEQLCSVWGCDASKMPVCAAK